MVLETMAGILGRATGLLDDGSDVLYECRRCGVTVDCEDRDDPDPPECPNCGPEGVVVRYDID